MNEIDMDADRGHNGERGAAVESSERTCPSPENGCHTRGANVTGLETLILQRTLDSGRRSLNERGVFLDLVGPDARRRACDGDGGHDLTAIPNGCSDAPSPGLCFLVVQSEARFSHSIQLLSEMLGIHDRLLGDSRKTVLGNQPIKFVWRERCQQHFADRCAMQPETGSNRRNAADDAVGNRLRQVRGDVALEDGKRRRLSR